MNNPKILVVGVGGIGGYFGGRLAESGQHVTFLVRDARRRQLAEQGLRIDSPFGDARLAVTTVVARELTPSFDIVILACKAYDLDDAVADLEPALAPHGCVLPFLNGLAHIDALNRRFGQHRVLGGTAKIQSTLLPDGTVKQFNDWRTLTFGEQGGEPTPVCGSWRQPSMQPRVSRRSPCRTSCSACGTSWSTFRRPPP